MAYIQVLLKEEDGPGVIRTWVENDKRIKVGNHCTLKDFPGKRWEFSEISSLQKNREDLDKNRVELDNF